MRATGIASPAGLAPLSSTGHAKRRPSLPMCPSSAVPETEAAARQADVAEHAGERDQHPVRLLAVVAALQRPRCVQQRPIAGHLTGQVGDRRRGDAGDGLGPGRRLGRPVRVAEHVGRGTTRSPRCSGRGNRGRRDPRSRARGPVPSIRATSVPGRTGSNGGRGTRVESSPIGPMLTKRTPRSTALLHAAARRVLGDAAVRDLAVA